MAVTYYKTEEGFQVAVRHAEAERIRAHHAGFTSGGHAFIRWDVGTGRSLADGAGFFEHTLAHEIVHQLQHDQGPRFNYDQPPWLVEASADVAASAALAHIYKISKEQARAIAGRHRAAKRAMEQNYLIPVGKFLDADRKLWSAEIAQTVTLFYSEGVSLLCAMSDKRDSARDFFRTISRPSFNMFHADAKLQSLFGDTGVLEAKLRAWLRLREDRFDVSNLETRALPDDGYHFESAVRSYGTALLKTKLEKGVIEVDAEPTAATGFYQVVLGMASDKEASYGVRISGKGGLEVFQFSPGKPHALMNTLTAPARHRVWVQFDAMSLVVKVDDDPVASVALPVPPKGRVGIGLRDGALTVHSWKVTP